MTDASNDSIMDMECEKSIPTALDHENNSHLDDSAKQSPVATSHENPNVITLRTSERNRQRRGQESDEARKKRLQRDKARHQLHRLQESEQETQECRRQNARREKRRREQETDDERHERQVKDTIRHRHGRQRSSSLYAVALQNEFPPESYHGRMDKVCRHCNDLHFNDECASDRQE
ncbi:unnamed protein product [Rotaria sp. Silwood2]|nr:unnamed protein product [Rotaria sp. Silwood2]